MHPSEDHPDGSPGTLGALLYADKSSVPPPEHDWAALVRRMAAGELQALHALYDRTHRLVFTLIVRIVQNRETAEELTLDVFHDVWRRAATYDPASGSVVGWVMNQARSRAIDRWRFEQRKKRVDPQMHDGGEGIAAGNPYESLQMQQRARLLHGALSVLSEVERRAIESAFFGGLTYAEVAEQLAEPLGTVKTRIRSGLQKLRRALGEEPQA